MASILSWRVFQRVMTGKYSELLNMAERRDDDSKGGPFAIDAFHLDACLGLFQVLPK